ncbi:flagellar biosynthetic protein FliO [Opitutus sp. ER46]|uniref:flagellar biosynthetic protein FliO n=1 Tax=Opitutus sp. ER46 TaxID=2161864 RepID=UPI000D311E80|nr:flagellar biosynthetic protein FliO [Opitutus sp. ER46]PTX90908.1 hypothetical protein DB354_19850 [Opitutus sp. ER46]
MNAASRVQRTGRGATAELGLMLRRFARGLVFLALFSTAALAADDNRVIYPGGTARPEAPAASAGGMANNLTLAVAVLLAAGGLWLFLRNRRAQGLGGRPGSALAVEETRSLGNRQFLVVASYGEKKFLLGVCPGRIEMLSTLNDGPVRPTEETK